jgi:integrase
MPSEKERVVRRRLATGEVKEYRYARKPPKAPRQAADSLGALIIAYRRSLEWARLAPASRKLYGIYLRDLEDFANAPVVSVRRRDLLHLRDVIAEVRGHGAANGFMRSASALFSWARERDIIEHSPAEHVRTIPGGHLTAWTAAEADAAEALPEPLRRVIILARYTGQRRGDLVALTWHAYDGNALRIRQQKTGAALVLPVHPRLRVELDRWRASASSTHILTSPLGRPWRADHLTSVLGKATERLGLRAGLNVHGLRKLAATALAEAGCSVHEIAAVTGHRTIAMVQLYTASADQERLAGMAISRLGKTPDGKRGKTLRK